MYKAKLTNKTFKGTQVNWKSFIDGHEPRRNILLKKKEYGITVTNHQYQSPVSIAGRGLRREVFAYDD